MFASIVNSLLIATMGLVSTLVVSILNGKKKALAYISTILSAATGTIIVLMTTSYQEKHEKPVIVAEQYPTVDTLITKTTAVLNSGIPETKIDTTYTFNFTNNDNLKFISVKNK